ncbi:MAG: hypothetical protein ACRD4D_01830 [Candidatus Acidiferrales bacterium]
MRKLFTTSLAIALVALLAASPVLAKARNFTLYRDARLNGTELPAGTYKLELGDDGKATIYNSHQKSPVMTAAVKVKPAKGRAAILIDGQGNLVEIRTGKEIVVFVR